MKVISLSVLTLLAALAVQAEVVMVSGTVYDVGKGAYSNDPAVTNSDDDLLCWAATSANMIQHWQDAYGAEEGAPNGYSGTGLKYPGGTQYLDIYDTFTDNFVNQGGFLMRAVEWYFNGRKINEYGLNTSSNANAGLKEGAAAGGFDPSRNVHSAETRQLATLAQVKSALASAFENEGTAVYVALTGDVAHAVTCWGYETDSKGTLTAIYLTDSDDQQFGARRLLVNQNNGYVSITSPYTDGNYADGDYGKSYKIGSISFIVSDVTREKSVNTLSALPDNGMISRTADMSGQYLFSEKGVSTEAGGILASSGEYSMLYLGNPETKGDGNGLTAKAGSLVSLNTTDLVITNFSGDGLAVGAEVYLHDGNFKISDNSGAGLIVKGTAEDPKAFLEASGNTVVELSGNHASGLVVSGGKLVNPANPSSYSQASGEASFVSNYSVDVSDNTGADGAGAYVTGNLSLVNNTFVNFSGNQATGNGGGLAVASVSAGTSTYTGMAMLTDNDQLTFIKNVSAGNGGAIYAGNDLLLDNNTVLSIQNNRAAVGSAIYVNTDRLVNLTPTSVGISRHDQIDISGNVSSNADTIYNRGAYLLISGNGVVDISDNNAGAMGAVVHNAGKVSYQGGFSYVPTVEIAHNDSVTFSGNTAAWDIFNQGNVYLSADAGKSITFQHGIRNDDAQCNVYFGKDASQVASKGDGDYVFTDGTGSVTMRTSDTLLGAGSVAQVYASMDGWKAMLEIANNAQIGTATFILSNADLNLVNVAINEALTVNFGSYLETNTLTMTACSPNPGVTLSMIIDLASPPTQMVSAGIIPLDGNGSSLTATTVTLADYIGPGSDLGGMELYLTLTGQLASGAPLIVNTNGFDLGNEYERLTVSGYTLDHVGASNELYYYAKPASDTTPEPTTATLSLLALAALAARRRRKAA